MVGEAEQRARFSRALQEAMETRRMSARQLSIALQVDPRRIAGWLKAKGLPNLYEAAALASALRVKEDLFRNPPEVPPPPPKPYYPIDKYLVGPAVELVTGAVGEGLVEAEGRSRRPRAAEAPSGPRSTPGRRARAAGRG
jgi:transcriptional regulator with XRE-family HTH domain